MSGNYPTKLPGGEKGKNSRRKKGFARNTSQCLFRGSPHLESCFNSLGTERRNLCIPGFHDVYFFVHQVGSGSDCVGPGGLEELKPPLDKKGRKKKWLSGQE